MYNKADFKETHREEFHILSKDYLYNGADEGLTFVVKSVEGHVVKEMYLPYDEMNNIFQFKKDKREDVKLVARGIEEGEENRIIIQYGELPSPSLVNKEKTIVTKIVTVYLKRL